MVLLADELAASIAAHLWSVMLAKSGTCPPSCVLRNGAEVASVCRALSLGSADRAPNAAPPRPVLDV